MATTISSFGELILGHDVPAILNVERFGYDGVIVASFHDFPNKTHAEFRKKDTEYALFLFPYIEDSLPEWWKDSELIWSIG